MTNEQAKKVDVYDEMPDGWAELRGSTMAPAGYTFIYNKQPMWIDGEYNPERKQALLRLKKED